MERPAVLNGTTEQIKTDCGNMHLVMNYHKDSLYEVRMEIGKNGHCQKGLLWLIGILISEKIQKSDNRKDLKSFLRRHLDEFSCPVPFFHAPSKTQYKSCVDYVAKRILGEIKEEEGKKP